MSVVSARSIYISWRVIGVSTRPHSAAVGFFVRVLIAWCCHRKVLFLRAKLLCFFHVDEELRVFMHFGDLFARNIMFGFSFVSVNLVFYMR